MAKTNADHIRSLDNRGLAEALAGMLTTDKELHKYIPDCKGGCPEHYQGDCHECVRTIQAWLEAEKT